MIPSWTPRYKLHEGDRESIGAGINQRIITDRWPDHTMTVPVNTAWIFTGHYAMNVPNGFIGQIGIQLSDTAQTNNTLQAACTVTAALRGTASDSDGVDLGTRTAHLVSPDTTYDFAYWTIDTTGYGTTVIGFNIAGQVKVGAVQGAFAVGAAINEFSGSQGIVTTLMQANALVYTQVPAAT